MGRGNVGTNHYQLQKRAPLNAETILMLLGKMRVASESWTSKVARLLLEVAAGGRQELGISLPAGSGRLLSVLKAATWSFPALSSKPTPIKYTVIKQAESRAPSPYCSLTFLRCIPCGCNPYVQTHSKCSQSLCWARAESQSSGEGDDRGMVFAGRYTRVCA